MGTSKLDFHTQRSLHTRASKASDIATTTTTSTHHQQPSISFDQQLYSRQQPPRTAKTIPVSSPRITRKTSSGASSSSMATHMPRTSSRSGGSYSSPASSDDGRSMKLTKTGRVSKALKGRPVHKCDVCDKCYTRAEHLRRHQLNHKGARPYHCDVPGCEKSRPNRGFYREDLLLRHIEDHNSGPSDPMSESNLATEQRRLQKQANLDLMEAYRRSPSVFSDTATMSMVNSISNSEFMPHSTLGASCDTSYTPSLGPAYSPMVSHSLQTPSLYGSPPPEQNSSYPPYFLNSSLGVDSWQTAQFEMTRSTSPVSVVSSFNIQAWHEGEQRSGNYLMTPPESDRSTFATTTDPSVAGLTVRHDRLGAASAKSGGAMTPTEYDMLDDMRITRDISMLPAIIDEPQAPSRFQALQELYLPAFWRNFYPTFPIIHRPSFNTTDSAPPLLKGLMIAIGASYVNDTTARIVARTLRNTCASLVEKRPNYLYAGSRIWDLQIVFLAEAFSLFRSRRPSTRLSSRFETLCATLQFDTAVSASKTPEDLAPMAYSPDDETASCIRSQWIDNESKRRIFLACYVLEAQRASLFQQHRTISDDALPFTCCTPLWEARELHKWSELAQRESYNPQQLYHALHHQSSVPYDTFTSAIVTAYITSSDHPMEPPPQGLDSIVPHPRNSLSYHAMMLASHTPIRNLLAVSGDTFVFSEKLATHVQYEQAYIDLRSWVNSPAAPKAMFHAIRMLKTAFENGRCGLLHEEWALYIAALVCWACGMWEQGYEFPRHSSPSLGIDEQMGAFLGRFDNDACNAGYGVGLGIGIGLGIADANSNANMTLDGWTGTRACLAWVQNRISGQLGGLVEDAVTVLDKLVTNRMP